MSGLVITKMGFFFWFVGFELEMEFLDGGVWSDWMCEVLLFFMKMEMDEQMEAGHGFDWNFLCLSLCFYKITN